MKDLKLRRIGVVTFPFSDQKSATAGHELFSNFLKILEPLSSEMFVITGNFPEGRICSEKVHIQNINRYGREESFLPRIFKYVWTQIKISTKFIKISKNIDIVILFIGGAALLLPILSAKLLRKRVVLFTPGSASQIIANQYDGKITSVEKAILYFILRMLERINLHLADRIVVESEGAIDSMGLEKYKDKLSVNCSLYVDFDLFKIDKALVDRRNLIGYIGRLSSEKGVLNFVKAIPLILKERGDLEFLIGGDGQLLGEIRNELKRSGAFDKVEFTGWIPHDELPKYLNELKLIISPSYTEGGIPAVIQEAMACGTIALVTAVAGVDVIKDGETGFILEDNSPECIARKVIQVLKHPQLKSIINNAHNLAREEYSYESEVRRYRNMLCAVSPDLGRR